MDIFNRKRIAELEKKLYEAVEDRDKYRLNVSTLTAKLEAITKLEENIPEDCTKGPWCQACEFVKVLHYSYYRGGYSRSTNNMYVCNKANICKNFIQKEIEE